jgi:hypothetical protein
VKLPDLRHWKTTLHVTLSKDWRAFSASKEPLSSLDVDSKSSSTIPDRVVEGLLTFRSIWRPLFGPLKDWPLAVCDFRSLDASRDLIASDNILPHTVGETYNVLHNKQHEWYYLRDQIPTEILIFKSFDSMVGVAISKSHQSTEFVILLTR